MSTIYRVKLAGEMQSVPCVRFASSMAGVREAKKELSDKLAVSARRCEVTELEIEFSKSGMLAFLNEHCKGGGLTESGGEV